MIKKAISSYNKNGLAHLVAKGPRYLLDQIIHMLLSLPIIDHIFFWYSTSELEGRMKEEQDLSDILDTTGTYFEPQGEYRGAGNYKSLQSIQSREEISETAERAKLNQPSTVMEIGSAKGGTAYIWSRYLDTADTVLCLDMGFNGRKKLLDYFASYSGKQMFCVEGNSHTDGTKNRVEEILSGEQIDFLYIDGDHSYQGVKSDFEMYKPLMSNNGIIGIHDIEYQVTGVPEFWGELEQEYDCEKIPQEGASRGVTGLVKLNESM